MVVVNVSHYLFNVFSSTIVSINLDELFWLDKTITILVDGLKHAGIPLSFFLINPFDAEICLNNCSEVIASLVVF